MARFITNSDSKTEKETPAMLTLKRATPTSLDEIEVLKNSINKMQKHLWEQKKQTQHQLESRDETIEKQNEALVYSSYLIAMGELAGGVAHEINNPIAIIDGNNAIISRSHKEMKIAHLEARTNKISEMVARISSIVQGLLHLTDKANLSVEEKVSVKSLLENVLLTCEAKLKNAEIKFTITEENTTDILYGNSSQLGQVILNIFNNAYDALKKTENPFISVRFGTVSAHPKNLYIHISNNGEKIPRDIRNQIFARFFTTKDVGKGMGIGLSVSKGIVENHRGSLELLDTELTTFSIKLPTGPHSA